MDRKSIVQHVALQCPNEAWADTFFTKVLGIPKVKSTMLPAQLCAAIFQIDRPVQMLTYDNGEARFEVFLTSEPVASSYVHVGVAVDSTSDFVARCQAEGLTPFFVQKETKQLLFVRDFSGNLFEIVAK